MSPQPSQDIIVGLPFVMKTNHLRKRPHKLFGSIFKRAFPEHNPALTVVQGGSALYASVTSRQHVFKTNFKNSEVADFGCFRCLDQSLLSGGAFYSIRGPGQHLFKLYFKSMTSTDIGRVCR